MKKLLQKVFLAIVFIWSSPFQGQLVNAANPIEVINTNDYYFLQIDLSNSNIGVQTVVANNDTGGKQTLAGMSQRLSNQGYADWAIINADLFSWDCPSGTNCGQGLTYISGVRKNNWVENGETWRARGNIGFDSNKQVEINVGDAQTKRHMTVAGGPRVVINGSAPTCYGELFTVDGKTKTLFPFSGEQFDLDVRGWCTDTREITMIGYSADQRTMFIGISKGGKTVVQVAQELKNRGAHEVLRFDSGSSSGIIHNGSVAYGSTGKPIANAFAVYLRSGSGTTDQAKLYNGENLTNFVIGKSVGGPYNEPNSLIKSIELPQNWSARLYSQDGGNGTHVCVSATHNKLSDMGWVVNTESFTVYDHNECNSTPPPPSNGTCNVPASGDWVLTASCSFQGTGTAPANVIVQNNAVLTIENNAVLNIDMTQYSLKVKQGSGVLIKLGGKIG